MRTCVSATYVARSMTTEEISGVAALPLFLALRAAIRAIVTIDRLKRRRRWADVRTRWFAISKSYLLLAETVS